MNFVLSTTTGASSQLDGVVQINQPDVDPTRGLIELPDNIIDRSQLIAQSCPANDGNKFIVTGRGGLPVTPFELLSSYPTEELAWVTTGHSLSSRENNSFKQKLTESPIIEANNWVINKYGEVMLIASGLKSVHGNFNTLTNCL